METRYVTIASFRMPHEAQVAASILEEKSIPTRILDNNTNPISGGYVEIRLQVPEQSAEHAVELLDALLEEGVDLLEDVEDVYQPEPEQEAESYWKDVPEGTKPVICPRCLSLNSHKTLAGPVPGWLNVLLLGLPKFIFPDKLQCRACGTIFT